MINVIAGGIFCTIMFGFWCVLRLGCDHAEITQDSKEEK